MRQRQRSTTSQPAGRQRTAVGRRIATSVGFVAAGLSLLASLPPTSAHAVTAEVIFTFDPLPDYHVNEGATLTFTATATLGGSPLTVIASGLPSSASFDGTNFSWEGEFEGNGRHEITFSADGDSELVIVATTEYPLVDFLLYSEPTVPLVGDIKIPEGGQSQVLAGGLFDAPFGISPIAGRGTNSWAAFLWSIADTSIASFVSVTNVAVFQGELPGATTVMARFTDATLGEMAAVANLDVLGVVSIAVDPVSLSFPEGSTELLFATATLDDASQTQAIDFSWSSSDDSIATVTEGSLVFGTGHVGNVTGQAQGTATITAFVPNAAMVSGSALVTLVAPLRTQLLYGMDVQVSGNRVVTIDAVGGGALLAALQAPYDDTFGPSASLATNELLVAGFEDLTGFSEIQRISAAGGVTAVFTSDSLTGEGDTIDPRALEYRSDGWAYFAMSEGARVLSRISPSGSLSNIGGPNDPGSIEDAGPTAIAPFGTDLVYSGPWSFDLSGGFVDLVARYDDASGSNESFVWPGFAQPQLAAPAGDLHILDRSTGEIFRFVDLAPFDGDHFEIVGVIAQDDPNERVLAGMLPSGFDTLTLDESTGDMITTRIVGNPPQRILVMRLKDLNADGDFDDAGEQTIVFDAGAPPGTDIEAVRLTEPGPVLAPLAGALTVIGLRLSRRRRSPARHAL